jgi:hypothetical protein
MRGRYCSDAAVPDFAHRAALRADPLAPSGLRLSCLPTGCRGDKQTPKNARGKFEKDPSMKLILTLLGVVLLVIAAVYFLIPADQLPGFFPGHEAGVTRVHTKHGIVSGVAGVVLLAAGAWMGRR